MGRPAKPAASTPGRRFQTFIVAVCQDTRIRTNASYERIADLAGVSGNSVRRFESGQTWPHYNLEDYVAAYAEVDKDVRDPRELYDKALDWWVAHGKAPLLARANSSQQGVDGRAIRRIREVATAPAKARADRHEHANTRATRRQAAG